MIVVLLLLAAALPVAAFEPALPGYRYEFPRDHFAHPEFEIEWWYYTGNLFDSEGRRFGFELTFFRNAVEREPPTTSPWDIDQIYLAHLTLTEVESGRFFQHERLNRAGPGLAGADPAQSRIWNGNWEVRWEPGGLQRLRAVSADVSLDLTLDPAKPPVIHGLEGVSQKADGAGKASHYVSFTRLQTAGTVTLEGKIWEVAGETWMDHEFSSNSMGAGQVGWDWISAQLDDGAELMLYRMRRDDGSTDPNSAGTYVDAQGRSTHLESSDFTMTPSKPWTSPTTGGRYPLRWDVQVPKLNLRLAVTTPVPGQEVASRAGPKYWEGAVDYEGSGPEGLIHGIGYVEMTGYDKPLSLGVER